MLSIANAEICRKPSGQKIVIIITRYDTEEGLQNRNTVFDGEVRGDLLMV